MYLFSYKFVTSFNNNIIKFCKINSNVLNHVIKKKKNVLNRTSIVFYYKKTTSYSYSVLLLYIYIPINIDVNRDSFKEHRKKIPLTNII